VEPKEITYYHTLYEVAKVINSSLEMDTLLKNIAEQAAKAMDCKGCTIRLLDKKGESLIASATFGLSIGYMHKGQVLIKKSGLDREVLAGKHTHIRDAATDKRFQYPAEAKAEGIASLLTVPLMVEGKAIGVMRVYSGKIRDFAPEEVDFLTSIANLSAIAIHNARLHEAVKINFEACSTYQSNIHEE
jgi:signal transduction protein with GAF and PtsI domain